MVVPTTHPFDVQEWEGPVGSQDAVISSGLSREILYCVSESAVPGIIGCVMR